MTAALSTRFERRSEEQLSLVAASLAVFVWGFGPLLVKGVHASAAAIVCWRLLFAQPVMIGTAYLTGGRLSWDVMKRTCVPGLLFGSSMAAGFVAYQKTSIVNATLIGSMQPALLLMAAPFLFGTRTRGRQLLFSLVAFAGVAAVVLGAGKTSGASLAGDLWAVLNLCVWSVYFVRAKQIRDTGLHAPTFIAGVFLWSAIFVVPISVLTVRDLGDAVGVRPFLLILGMVAGPGLVGHGLMTWSQKHLDIRIPSLLNLANPVVSTIGAWAIYSQSLRWVQVLGGATVLAGLAGVVWDHQVNRAGVMEPEPT